MSTARPPQRRIIVAVTGASGTVYARRLLDVLTSIDGVEVLLLASPTGLRVAAYELEARIQTVEDLARSCTRSGDLARITPISNDFFAPVASGSCAFEAMVTIPCSGGRLGSFAAGVCSDLLDRAAEVTLKEGRRLILVHRETPLSRIHLENMLRLQSAGAIVLPANPGFYHRPQTVREVIDYVIARVLDQLHIHSELVPRWDESAADPVPPEIETT